MYFIYAFKVFFWGNEAESGLFPKRHQESALEINYRMKYNIKRIIFHMKL